MFIKTYLRAQLPMRNMKVMRTTITYAGCTYMIDLNTK